MKELHTLHDTAQEMLGGLTAGEALRRRVLAQAEAPERQDSQTRLKPRWWTYASACAALALVIGISALTINRLNVGQQADDNPIEMIAAGQATMVPGGVLVGDVPEDSLVIVDGGPVPVEPVVEVPEDVQQLLGGEQPVETIPEQTAEEAQPQDVIEQGDVQPQVVSEQEVFQQQDVGEQELFQQQEVTEQEAIQQPQVNLPGYSNLFAQGDGANVPLVGLLGRAYQQMQVGVSQNLVGDPIGTVALYTAEPALAAQDAWSSILSNVVSEGTMVYMVQGVSAETAVTAEVNGNYMLFQRVSFAGYGTSGQSLEQVMDVRGNVASMTLSGVGSIYDSGKANAMMSLLLDNASFYADNFLQGGQSLDITLTNGLTLQLQIADRVFTACGSWTCSEFFDQFQSMLAQ